MVMCHQASNRASRISQFCCLIDVRFCCIPHGEVITIEGGERINGAGEFNHLNEIPTDMWDVIQAVIKFNTRAKKE